MDLNSYRIFHRTVQKTVMVIKQESTDAIQEVRSVSKSITKAAAIKVLEVHIALILQFKYKGCLILL